MLSLTIRSIRARKLRFLLTSVAILLGVAFMAGTLVLTDTIQRTYADVARNVYDGTDAVVRSDRHLRSDNDPTETRATIDVALADRIRAVDGVAVAEARISGIAMVVGTDGDLLDANPNRAIPIGLGWQRSPALNPMQLVRGHAPRTADEIVVDRTTARVGGFRLGERVRVLGPSGTGDYRLAGVARYGGADDAAGAQVVAFTPQTASEVLGTAGRASAIQVVAHPGITQTELAARLRTALGDDSIDVITGQEAAEEAAAASGQSVEFVEMFLVMFAIIALVVGSFVIYNTFSITAAQRTQETALLRAIGAHRRQVTRALRLEALGVGLFGSAVGVLVGVGTAFALREALEAFGMPLPQGGMVVLPRAILVSLLVGIVVTVLAASLPARRAARVAPVAALRDAATAPLHSNRRRAVTGGIVGALGAAALAGGLFGENPTAAGLGALVVFIGAAMLGPAVARPFVHALGWPIAAGRGVAGALARENAARNPRRTSATASSLMIGIGLVVLITVFAASTRVSLATTIDEAMKGDYIVRSQFGMGGFSPEVAMRLDALPETGSVTPLRYVGAQAEGATRRVTAFDPATIEDTVYTRAQQGSIAQVGRNEVAVHRTEAEARGLAVGDAVALTFPETGEQVMRVVAVHDAAVPLGDYAISLETLDAHVPVAVDHDVVVTNAPGVSMAEARRALERAIGDVPTAELMTRDDFKRSVATEIDRLLNLVYVMLAMALLIAFFGIANTLTLSVLERTREIGLLRAMGMSRAQVRSTVRWEAVLVALLGATLGTVIGVGFSWVLVRAMRDLGIEQWSVPTGELVLIIGLAAGAAVLAAAFPARRAARKDVLVAMGR